MTLKGVEVTTQVESANSAIPSYPLNVGDLLYPQPDGTFFKIAPGLSLGGFVLLEEQLETHTRAVNFVQDGLNYRIID